eukprot:6201417-Pleurochrysis_carterae.AAC.1
MRTIISIMGKQHINSNCAEPYSSRKDNAFRFVCGQSQGSNREARNKAEALACVVSLFKAKPKAVTIHVTYHSTRRSIACEESTFKVRERCVSHGGLDSRRR